MVISQSYDIRADFLHDIHTRRRQTEGILLIFRGNSPLTERKFFICHKNIGRSNLVSQPFIQYSGYSPGSVICVQNVVRQIDITAEQQGQLSRITGAGQMPELIIRSGQVPALFPRLYFKNRFLRQAFQILPAVLPGREPEAVLQTGVRLPVRSQKMLHRDIIHKARFRPAVGSLGYHQPDK